MGETETVLRRRRRPKTIRGPTLHDVARAAGVSTATVSRALSRAELVSDPVRRRVQAAIRTLAYVPNASAQVLSGRRSRLIGAVVSTLDDPLTAQALESLTRELATAGVALVLSVADEGATDAENCVRGLVARGAEAVVFCAGATPVGQVDLYRDRGVHFAHLEEAPTEEAPTWSGLDRTKAFILGVRYLYQLGHHRIGLFALGGRQYVDAARGITMETGIELVGDVRHHVRTGRAVVDAVDHWLSLPAPPTALVCGSDLAAAQLLGECRRREIAVPAQWSIIGFGDTEIARQTQPPLSTLRVPMREAGQALGRILVGTIEGRPKAPQELPGKVVARESTGRRDV